MVLAGKRTLRVYRSGLSFPRTPRLPMASGGYLRALRVVANGTRLSRAAQSQFISRERSARLPTGIVQGAILSDEAVGAVCLPFLFALLWSMCGGFRRPCRSICRRAGCAFAASANIRRGAAKNRAGRRLFRILAWLPGISREGSGQHCAGGRCLPRNLGDGLNHSSISDLFLWCATLKNSSKLIRAHP